MHERRALKWYICAYILNAVYTPTFNCKVTVPTSHTNHVCMHVCINNGILLSTHVSLTAVECDPPCRNGACVANNTCHCSVGYSGPQCDRIDNPGSCDLNPCARGELCAMLAGSHVCTPNCSQDSNSPLCSSNLGKSTNVCMGVYIHTGIANKHICGSTF